MLLAQITDLHVTTEGSPFDLRYRTGAQLARAVEHLCRLDPRPDAVLVTGDLVNEGSPSEYARLAQLLEPLPMPWYAVPGNHDDREHLRAAFGDRGYFPTTGALSYEVEFGPLRVIALDTNVPGAPGGRLGEAQLRWLDARLSEGRDRQTLLLMHHPPFATGIEGMDQMGLEDGEALAQVVSRHPQIERILCGHLHRPIVKRFAGTVASTCPSTGPQVALDLRPGVGVAMLPEPTACQLHLWRDGLGLVTHTSYVSTR